MNPVRFAPGLRPLLIAALLVGLPAAAQNLSSVSLSPTTVTGGTASTGTVTLSANAPTGGKVVTLSSGNTGAATVPTSVTVASGTKTKTFSVTTTPQPTNASAVITAVLGTVTKTATLSVKAPVMSAASVSPTSVKGGTGATLSVTLTGNAPAGGTAVTLTSSNAQAASLPSTVTVLAGAKTATATVTTLGVDANATVTLTATAGGVSKTAALTVEPAVLTGLTISPQSIPGETTATGTLTLDGPAGPSGATIGLASDDTNVATVPTSALIAAGQETGTFTITGAAVTDDAATTIRATLASETHAADLSVTRTIGTLTGTVKDASTGFTLPSAHVVLSADPARETWTDGNGQYQLIDVPAGLHTVELSHEGFSSVTSGAVTVTNGQTVMVPPVSLTPIVGAITGTILDQANGDQPLEGAVVTEATGLHTATTDANGRFELAGLAPGFTYLVVHRNGYRPGASSELRVDADWTHDVSLGVLPTWEGDLPGEIEGVVRDSAGNPAIGATVSVVGDSGPAATTGSDGRYSLTVPAALGWIVQAEKAGYLRTVSRYLRASMGDRPYHIAHDFALPPSNATGTLELRTFDPVSRNPFRADLWFRTPTGIWHAPVPDSGTRTIPGVPAGLVWDCFGQRILPAGGTLTLRCPGEPAVPPGSPRWAASGVVANAYSSEPIADATATFVNGSTVVPVTTDANGLFSTHSGPEGEYSVTVAAEGFLQTEPWVFTAADNQEYGSFYFAWLWPEMPGGIVSITAPAEGALLTSSSIQVEVAFAPARPGDQLLWAWAWPSTGNVTSVTPVYSADGMSAVVTIEGTFPNGPLTIGVEAATQTGAGLTAQRNLTVDLQTHPTSLSVSPSTVPGGSVATGTVTVDPPAPAGGAFVNLSSSSPVVAVPPSVSFAEGETSRTFEIVAAAVASQTVATITASAGPFTTSATLTVNPTVAPPIGTDFVEGDISAWQAFADPPFVATVNVETTRIKVGPSSLRFVTDSGFDCGVRYIVPGGAHWDLRGVRFLTFWSFGDNTEAFQGEQPVVILRGPGGSIRLQPPTVQTFNGEWRFHRVPLGSASNWIVTTEGEPSLGDITSFEIHQDIWGGGMTVFYDGVAFVSDIPEDLAEGTAALWGTFASDNATSSVVDDATDVRSGASALRFDTASGFDTGLVFPKAEAGQTHWDLSDVRSVTAWIRAEHVESFQGNYPVLILRSPSGLARYEPGDALLDTPGWRFYEIPLDGTFPWTRTQEGTPDLADVTAIEIHGDTWGSGFRLYVDGVSVGRPLPLLTLSSDSAPEDSTVTATVFLSDVAPAGGRTLLVSTSDPAIASVPASVVVPAGQRSTTFSVTAGSLTLGTPVTIAVTDRGFSARTSLRVDPIVDVTSLTLEAPSVLGGTPVTGTVTIEAPAGAGGVAVILASSNPGVASVPSALLIPEGAVIAPFTVTTVAVASSTPVSISANAGGVSATATLTVAPPVVPTLPPLATDLAEGDLSGWQGFADPPYGATVSLETTRTRVGSSSLRFVTDSGFDSGVRYTVPGGAHWDLSGIRFLTFWSFGDNTGAFQGEQPVVVLRGPGGSIRLQPPAVQTINGGWRFHRVPFGDTSDWIVTTEGTPSLGDISSFEIHQDIEGMGMTVFYDGVALTSDIPEDLAEGTAALWGTFASDSATTSVVDDASDVRDGTSALRFETASGFDTGLVFPKAGTGLNHWDFSDVRSVVLWIHPVNSNPVQFQGNQPVLVLRSPSGSVRYEPGDVLFNTPGWRFYEIPLDGAFPWTRTQTGTPDASDVTSIELHGDTWGAGFRLYVDGVSVGRPLPLVKLPLTSTPGGSTVTASVFLSDAAPVGGRPVLVSSSDSGLASVPASVLIPEGARTATFPVTTGLVTTATPVSITVTDRGFSARTELRVDPVVDVTSLTLGSPTTFGGLSVAGTVTIGAPAWSGGTAVALSSSNPGVASVPTVVTIPAGGSTASFSVTTGAVAADTTVSILANAGAATAAASLTVVPAPPPELEGLRLTPPWAIAGGSSQLQVSLMHPAPLGGAVVQLVSGEPSVVSVAPAVSVPGGAISATTSATVASSALPGTVVLTGSVGVSSRTAVLSIVPPAELLTFWCRYSPVLAGSSVWMSVRLTSPAPLGGTTIGLATSAESDLPVPSSVSVPEGQDTADLWLQVPADAHDRVVTVTATQGLVQKSATVTIFQRARVVSLAALSALALPGDAVSALLTLSAPAPRSGWAIPIENYDSGIASVPAIVTVPEGASSLEFSISVPQTSTGGRAIFGARDQQAWRSAYFDVAAFRWVGVLPTLVGPDQGALFRLALSAAVPEGRAVTLELTSSNPAVASLPPSVTLTGGQSSLDLAVTRVNVALDTTVDLSATAFGITRTVALTLEPLKLKSIELYDTELEAAVLTGAHIDLNGPAPADGAVVRITSGQEIDLIVGDDLFGSQEIDLLVQPGRNSASFRVAAGWYVDEPVPTTVTATYGGSSASTTITVIPARMTGIQGPGTIPGGFRLLAQLSFAGAAPFPVPVTFEASEPLLVELPDGVDPTSFYYPGIGIWTSWSFEVGTKQVSQPTPVTITARYRGTEESFTVTLEPIPAGKVVGQVVGLSTSGGGSVGLPFAEARIVGSSLVVPADGRGLFTLDMPTEAFSVSAGMPPEWTTEQIGPFEPSSSGLFVGVVELSRTARVVVDVDAGPAFGPAPGATVEMPGLGGPATTDSTGTATLRVKPYVAAFVRATKDGYEPATSSPFAATLEGATYVSLTLYPSVSPESLTVSPSALRGGSSASGQVVLSAAAPPSGSRVALSTTEPGVLIVPAEVFVPPGVVSASFTVLSNPVTEVRTVSVTATNAGVSRSVQVSVAPMTLTGLSLNPASLMAGASTAGTATLDGPAPLAGLTVSLSSSDATVAQVPPSVLVPSGAAHATFTITTSPVSTTKSVTITASISGSSASAILEVRVAPPTINGAAPGVALPGTSGIVVYGTGLGVATSVLLSGPVYSIGGTTPVCNIRGAQGPFCPEVVAAATPSADGKSLTFSLPSNASTGTYLLEVKAGQLFSTNGVPFLVEEVAPAFEVVTPEDHKLAQRIHPGQTVLGVLAGNAPNCPYGATDYNQYFFFGTAGSRINVRMERVDTSVPWSDPSSLDPQIEVVAPDGFIYGNLARFNDRPGVDFDATISNATLPQTGLYIILAETARGSGEYRLSLSFSSLAPAPPEKRVIPVVGNHVTGHVGDVITSWAAILDPRGHPLSGANTTFQTVIEPGDTGTIQFTSGANTQSSSTGTAAVSAILSSFGRVRFEPVLQQTFTAPAATEPHAPALTALATSDGNIPLYPAVAMRPFSVGHFDGQLLGVDSTRFERFPVRAPAVPSGPFEEPSAGARLLALDANAASTVAPQPYGPEEEARGEVPVARFGVANLAAASCQDGLRFHTFAVLPSAQINAPLTVTLEDLTPSTGGSTPNGPVGDKGIYGHRVEKEIRLRISVRDANGNEPDYPVLVSVYVGGWASGQIILDPDGSRIECPSATFVWHERDVNGAIVALNEVVGYRLGTYSDFVGLDLSLKPVWNWTELFEIKTFTPGQEEPSLQVFGVHPEPGKPDQILCKKPDGESCGEVHKHWTGYLAHESGRKPDGTPRYFSGVHATLTAYRLVDEFENDTFGYFDTSVAEAIPSTDVEFVPHVPGEVRTDQLQTYKLRVSWTNDPAWPNGSHPATLSVHYPTDPDWPAGDVTKEVSFAFETGQSHAISRHLSYDLIRPDGTRGVDDGSFPIRAYSKATAAFLPKTEAGDGVRLVLLAYRGEIVPGELPVPEPTETGLRMWQPEGSHWRIAETRTSSFLETNGPSAFRFTLIDSSFNVIPDGAFVVHRCPRFDHSAPGAVRPCELPPVASVSGHISSLLLNPAGPGAADSRGYFGLELTRAPEGLGAYYVMVESLSQEYRLRRQSDLMSTADVANGEFQGAFKLVDVGDYPCPDARCGTGGCNQCTGSPNYVSTGTYTTAATDMVVPTTGPAMTISRNYVSTPSFDGVVGPGWTSSLESRVYLAPYISGGVRLGTEANVVLPSGLRYKFRLNSVTGYYDPPAGRNDDLVRNADGSFDFFIERGSGSVYRFDKHGRFVSETDEFGNVVSWERDVEGRVTRMADLSGTGRSVTIGWTGAGKVQTLSDSAGRLVTYDYDADSRLTGITDPAGGRTQYDYSRGRYSTALLTKISDPWGRATTDVTYDEYDRTKSYTEQGATYTYTYAAANRTTKVDDSGHSTENTFDPESGVITSRSDPGDAFNKILDSEGRPVQVTDAAGVITTYSYDGEGHVLTVTRNAGQTGAVRYDYTYDPAFPDKVASVTPKNPTTNVLDPSWQGWRYEYHPAGSTRPGGLKKVYRVASDGMTADSVSEYEYDGQGRVRRQTTAGGAQTDYDYDGSGNLQTVTGPAGSGARPVTTYEHDALGRVTDVTDPLGKVTHYTYDALGRVLTVTLPPTGGRTFTTTYSYDHVDVPAGLLYTEITDPNGRFTRLGYDVDGRLRRSVDAAGGATLYAYTGRFLTTITDPNGNVTTYGYDAAKRLASTSFPDGGQETYTYWNDGLLKTKTDRRGTTVTYAYDAFKRLKTKSTSTGGSITYNYEGQRLLTVVDTTVTPAETHTFGYDARYRLASAAQAGRGAVGYTYTVDDRVETLTLPGGVSSTLGYRADGSLQSALWSPVPGSFTWDYTPRGQYDTVTFPDGQERAYNYDDQGRLTTLSNTFGAATLATFAYGYDVDLAGQPTLLGQRTSQTATFPAQGLTGALTRYGYDPLYQLVRAEYPAAAPFNAEVHTWTYDGIGNRETQGVGANVQTYTYLKAVGNSLNGQRLTDDGADTFGYDAAGNVTGRQGPEGAFTFGYDPENRLNTITGPENATYTYDYQGRRTSKTVNGSTTTYLYDGLNLVSETTNGQTTYFLNGPGIDEPLAMSKGGAVSYFSVDGLGSVVATNDPTGTVTHSVVFDAWGNVKAETGTRTHPFTYTGREVGEAGLHFYRARFYQPGVGRFSQEDPTGFTDGMHLYTYVSSDPANFIDPSGLGKVGWFVRTVKGVWKRVGKKAAERCLASGKDVKVVGRGSSGDARTMAKRRFGAKTDRHDPHPGYKNSHYQHKNGGQGHVFYRGAKALTAVGILGEHWYSDVIDFFNPISDGVEAGEMINEVVDAAFDAEDDCGCQ